MNWLFWKEFRQNRVIVIALVVMLIIPYFFALYATWVDMKQPKPIVNALQKNLAGASLFSLAISQVALALIGGNAISGERADRSAEFQAYLPLSRKKILAGKLLMALAIAASIWLTLPTIAFSLLCSIDTKHISHDIQEIAPSIVIMAITGFTFFCVAWLFSSILTSPTYSVVAGLITPFLVISLIAYVNYLIQGHLQAPGTEKVVFACYVGICFIIAITSFSTGTWLYLRRVEP